MKTLLFNINLSNFYVVDTINCHYYGNSSPSQIMIINLNPGLIDKCDISFYRGMHFQRQKKNIKWKLVKFSEKKKKLIENQLILLCICSCIFLHAILILNVAISTHLSDACVGQLSTYSLGRFTKIYSNLMSLFKHF